LPPFLSRQACSLALRGDLLLFGPLGGLPGGGTLGGALRGETLRLGGGGLCGGLALGGGLLVLQVGLRHGNRCDPGDLYLGYGLRLVGRRRSRGRNFGDDLRGGTG
jgi:hypothetical protein